MRYIDRILDRELKKGSAELLVLSLVEFRPRRIWSRNGPETSAFGSLLAQPNGM